MQNITRHPEGLWVRFPPPDKKLSKLFSFFANGKKVRALAEKYVREVRSTVKIKPYRMKRRPQKNNTSGIRGVNRSRKVGRNGRIYFHYRAWHKVDGKWKAKSFFAGTYGGLGNAKIAATNFRRKFEKSLE